MPGLVEQTEKMLSERATNPFFDHFGQEETQSLPGMLNHQINSYIKRVTTNHRISSYKGSNVIAIVPAETVDESTSSFAECVTEIEQKICKKNHGLPTKNLIFTNIDILKEDFKDQQTNPTILFKLAEAQFSQGIELDKCEKMLWEIFEIQPPTPKVLNLLARVLHAKGQNNACLDCFSTLLQLTSDSSNTYYLIGKVQQ